MGPKSAKKKSTKKKAEVVEVKETEYDTMDLEMLREVVPMLRQQLEKSMLDRNYVQLERDAIQQYYDITRREVEEIELAIMAKDREMELLEDNHRVELRVYQQKVKHLEYEHKNNVRDIYKEGVGNLDSETYSHEKREVDLLKVKEDLKFKKMEMELVNSSKVIETRQLHEKQLVKLRQQFDEGLVELTNRCEVRMKQLEEDLELQRRVEIHEVEERKNQHINDLIKNHKKAFGHMKTYYNEITDSNLTLIKSLQQKINDLKEQISTNKKELIEYQEQNLKLSEPLTKVSNEIAEVQKLLRDRAKDQMTLRNSHARYSSLTKSIKTLKLQVKQSEDEFTQVEHERDHLYNSFEETLRRIQQQSEFHNQSLQQQLMTTKTNAIKLATQTDEIIRVSNLDMHEIENIMLSLNQMISNKESYMRKMLFTVIKTKKQYNDSLEAIRVRLHQLGIQESDIEKLGLKLEQLPIGSVAGPADLITSI